MESTLVPTDRKSWRKNKNRHDPFDILFDMTSLIPEITMNFDQFAVPFDNFVDMGLPEMPGNDFSATAPFSPQTPGAATAPVSPGMPSAAVSPNSVAKGSDKNTENAPAKPQPDRPSSLGSKALGVARGEVGVKEQPLKSNDGPRVRQYQLGNGGNNWCAHFVSWCVGQAGRSPFKHTGLVSDLRRWGQSNGRYTSAKQATPQPGDIFTKRRYDEKGKLVGGHTGFVLSYDPKSRRMRTIEGNSNHRVREKSQSLSAIDGIVRI